MAEKEIMQGYTPYKYSVVRAIPNPVRDEAVNVGVTVVDEEQQRVYYQFLRNYESRVRKIAPEFPVKIVRAFRADFEQLVGQSGAQYRMELWPGVKFSPELLERITDAYAGQIQLTAARTTWAVSAIEATHKLFSQFIEVPERPKRPVGIISRNMVKEQAWSQLNLFSPPGEAKYEERVQGRSGATYILDTVFRNGNIRALFYSISFRVLRLEEIVLHRGYVLGAALDVRRIPQYEGLPLYVVVTEPFNINLEAYKESERSFQSEHINTILLKDLASIKEEIRGLLTS